jgi:hypothetical protein
MGEELVRMRKTHCQGLIMSSGNDATEERREAIPDIDERRRTWRTLRPRRPKSIW